MSRTASRKTMKSNNTRTKESIKDMQSSYSMDHSKSRSTHQNNKSMISTADFSQRILRATNVSLLGGPFHYSIRTGTYGDPYDEIPWKVRMGMSETKPRHGYGDNSNVCAYEPRVLMSNWVEERRDRNYIKYKGPRLSQFGHHYVSEAMRAFTKPLCNKQRDVLLNISTFPITPHPGHQPELNVDVLRVTAPTPDSCVVDETVKECKKEMDREKRYYKATKHLREAEEL